MNNIVRMSSADCTKYMAESDIQEMKIQVPVLGKIESIFEYVLEDGRPTGKTLDQVKINPKLYTVTAKFDGTCCYIKDGKIFARQDVKDKAPPGWFQTGEKGIGFRPLLRTDKWHLGAIIGEDALFLEYDKETKLFYYVMRPIANFNGKTAELVGPKVNGNKHKLEFHAYIIHGSIIVDAPWSSHGALKEWLANKGTIYEGIVIHDLGNSTLYKCHRGHLGGLWKGAVLPMR